MDEHADSARPLVDMMGDLPPEHDLRGRIIVLVIYACGGITGVTIVFEIGPRWTDLLLAVGVGALFFAPFAFVARAVERFASWSWAFVGGWLLLFFLISAAFSFDQYTSAAERGTAAAVAMMFLGGLHYLWLRRWDFWADARLERRRPPPRAVTAEWRAARLASIAAEAGRVRRRVSPRPGALWMRRTSA